MSIVDFHNHVIPGVDDGASDDAEAAAALREFLAQDVRRIVATPHLNASLAQRPPLLARRLDEIDAGWARLERIVRDHAAEMSVSRGAEIMLDTPDPDLSDERLRLGGTHFVLCEFPYMTVPPNSTAVLQRIAAAGLVAIIAHPERYAGVDGECAMPRRWRDAGALLQVNAGSITGRYGDQPRLNAFALLDHGLVDFICSDYHSRGRPATAGAREILMSRGGAEQLELLMQVNPRRMLEGQLPLPMPPLHVKLGVKDRIRRWLR